MEIIFDNLLKYPEKASEASNENLFTTWGMLRAVQSLKFHGIRPNKNVNELRMTIEKEISKRRKYTTIGLPAYYTIDDLVVNEFNDDPAYQRMITNKTYESDK